MSAQSKTSFLLFLLGHSFLYLDAVSAFILVVMTDCLLVLLLNIPVVVGLYFLVSVLPKRWYKAHP